MLSWTAILGCHCPLTFDDRPIENPQKAAERLRQRANVPDLRLHDFRRTAASLMTGMGISRLTVKKILNHAEREVTAIYDRHSYDPEKRSALQAWGRRLEEIVSGPKMRANIVAVGRTPSPRTEGLNASGPSPILGTRYQKGE